MSENLHCKETWEFLWGRIDEMSRFDFNWTTQKGLLESVARINENSVEGITPEYLEKVVKRPPFSY